jgi:hypothetical protein
LRPAVRLPVAALLAVVAACSCGAGCPFPRDTRVALVMVRNDTGADLQLSLLLRGHSAFTEEGTIKAKDSLLLDKYEEPVLHPTPIEDFVSGLRVKTPSGCLVTLDQAAVIKATERDKTHRWWIIHLSPELVRSAGCREGEPSPR